MAKTAIVATAIGLAGTIGYLYWTLYKEMRKAREERRRLSPFLQQRVDDIEEDIQRLSSANLTDRLEDHLENKVIEPEEKDDDGKVTKKEVSEFIVSNYGGAVRNLVVLAKLEFGGSPKPTEANRLAVWRYLVKQCSNRRMNATNTKSVVTAAIPYVFLPNSEDLSGLMSRNG